MHDAPHAQVIAARGPLTGKHTKLRCGIPRRLIGDAVNLPSPMEKAPTRASWWAGAHLTCGGHANRRTHMSL